MPMTLRKDIEDYSCVDCGKPATHFYSWGPICCECHLRWANLRDQALAQVEVVIPPLDGPPLDDPAFDLPEDVIQEIERHRRFLQKDQEFG